VNIPIGEWSGANATVRLEKTIERIEKENVARERWMLVLTAVGAVAAIVAAMPVVWGWLH
jgi:hypothetical protein